MGTGRAKRLIKIALLGALVCPPVAAGSMGCINYKMQRDAAPKIYDLGDRNIPKRKIAIVLGARVMPDGKPSTSLRDRLFIAWKLYEKKKVDKILVTGDHAARGYNEVHAMYKWLRARGVPSKKIFVDHAGLRTLDSMRRAAGIFKVEDAIICTQEFHLARSIFLAESYGIDAIGVKADQRVYAKRQANRRREFVARTVAFMDVYVLDRQPKYWGEEIPISGDARESHDKGIRDLEK